MQATEADELKGMLRRAEALLSMTKSRFVVTERNAGPSAPALRASGRDDGGFFSFEPPVGMMAIFPEAGSGTLPRLPAGCQRY